jgi:hypothetical protein
MFRGLLDQRSYRRSWFPHSYFVLSDHRTMSNDSRDLDPVDTALSTAKRCLGIGRWIRWGGCGENFFAPFANFAVKSF